MRLQSQSSKRSRISLSKHLSKHFRKHLIKRSRSKRSRSSVKIWPRSRRRRSRSVRMRFWLQAYLRRKFFSQSVNIWLSVSSLSLAHYQQERSTSYSYVTLSTQETFSWVQTKKMSDVSWDELDTLSFHQTKEVSVLIQSNVVSIWSRDSSTDEYR